MKFFEDAYKIRFEGFEEDVYRFRFISTGDDHITKIVSFSLIDEQQNWFNLGFGNLEQDENGKYIVNHLSRKNNNDFDKVLTTVFNCILYFLYLREDASVLFFGNVAYKNDMYKRKISANRIDLAKYLNISGGRIVNDIPIIKEEYTVENNNRKRKRVIEIKDINSIIEDVEIDYIEEFKSSKKDDYQFILLSVK